jgi:hydrogenase expression/formation protein HypC
VVIGLLSEAKVGMYVIVHAGYAIEVMNEEQARESLNLWDDLIEKENINPEDIV